MLTSFFKISVPERITPVSLLVCGKRLKYLSVTARAKLPTLFPPDSPTAQSLSVDSMFYRYVQK
jgi:hypothetical protein